MNIVHRCREYALHCRGRLNLTCLFSVWLVFLLPAMVPVAYGGDSPPVRLGTSYTFVLSNQNQTGMLDRIAREAFQRLKLTVMTPYVPAERSLIMADSGLNDGVLNRIEGLESRYPNLVMVPESNMDFRFVAFSRKCDIQLDGWQSLAPYRIGFVKGWKIVEENVLGLPRTVSATNARQLFTMLQKDRIDVAIYGELLGRSLVQRMDLSGVSVLEPPLAQREMYMYLNVRHKELAPQLAESIRSMKGDGTYDSIVAATTSLSNHL